MGSVTALTSYGVSLAPISSVKYLGRILLESDDDWLEVVRNLRLVQKKWARLTQVLGIEEEDAWTLGAFYIAVVQVVHLYGSETWVMFPFIGTTLGGFHHRVARRLMGRQIRRVLDGTWVYPPLAEVMTKAVLQKVDT